jgi:hypothetical protein
VSRAVVRVRVVTGLVALVAVIGAVVVVSSHRSSARSVGAFCEQIGEARELDEALATLDADEIEPGLGALRRAARVAPDDIAPDVETVLELTTTIQRTVGTATVDKSEALQQALHGQSDDLSDVQRAGRSLQQYTNHTCGLELSAENRDLGATNR